MPKQTYQDKLHLDMSFTEALERFVGTDPAEMHANIARSKKAKPPGGKKRAPSGDKVQAENVVSLRAKREKRRNGR
jgi:hypothetical protein